MVAMSAIQDKMPNQAAKVFRFAPPCTMLFKFIHAELFA